MKVEPMINLQRQATHFLGELHESREFVLITEQDRLSAYLVDVDEFETMQHRSTLLEVLSRGEKAAREGRVLSHVAARGALGKWLK